MSTLKRESKYSKLDEAILAKLSHRPTAFFAIADHKICAMVEEVSAVRYPATVIDRRLQVLRKAGRIVNVAGQGWALADGEKV